jgi:hypothetical protein
MSDLSIDPKNTILFVGAGVSATLGLPSWEGLIEHIGDLLDFDPQVFKQFGSYLSLAEYYSLKHGSIGPLRSWMDVQWHQGSTDIASSAVHAAIVKAGFRKIYTTNFDRWLERACQHWQIDFRKILTVNDDDNTLVLTETSYFERLDFQSPLDVVLRADVLKYSVLFVGYSLSDINVRYLFHKLAKTWREAGINTDRPKSYIFMMRPNPVEEKVFEQWGITPIVAPSGDPTSALASFLSKSLETRPA